MTGIPLFWSREFKTSTTWRASFATEEQFKKKTCEGPLANLCRLQDKLYDSDDDDDDYDDDNGTGQESKGKATSCIPEETNSTLQLEEVNDYTSYLKTPSVICSSLNTSSPFSDITAYSDDTSETTSILQLKEEEDEEIKKFHCEPTTKPKLQTISWTVSDRSNDGVSTCVPVRTTLTDSNIPLQNKLSKGDHKTHDTHVYHLNETNFDSKCLCIGAQRVYGLHRTSPSPFSSIRIHRSKQTLFSSDNNIPPVCIEARLYVIPELQELGLQYSLPHNSGCGSG